jgi:hypothetical protein
MAIAIAVAIAIASMRCLLLMLICKKTFMLRIGCVPLHRDLEKQNKNKFS